MKRTADLVAWLALAVAGAALLAWAFPRVQPNFPRDWRINEGEAEAIALERFRDLGPPVEDAYVQVVLDDNSILERRLWMAGRDGGVGDFGASRLAADVLVWEVTVFGPGARAGEWTYRARVAPSGEVTAVILNVPPSQQGGEIDAATARARADAFLAEQGFDLARFAAPEERTRQLQTRTDRTLRYRDRSAALGEAIPYGVGVSFAGDRLTGFSVWLDDPEEDRFLAGLQGFILLQQAWLFLPVLLLPVVGVFFVRRYHEGEVGVHRGLQIAALSLAAAAVFLVLCARGVGASWDFGALTRRQTTWVATFQIGAFYFFPMALIAALSWSVGEALCRERHGWRLAGFDALLKGELANATVARDSLRGVAAGVAASGALLALIVPLHAVGIWAPLSLYLAPWWHTTSWFGVAVLAFLLPSVLYGELFGRLLLVSALAGRLGRWAGGALVAVATGLLLFPPVLVLPFAAGIPLWIAFAGLFVALFLRYGLATAVLAALTSTVLLEVYPLLLADDAWTQFQACLPLLAAAVPLIGSLRHLGSGREFSYRYDDVPPHVRRIAERERQRVELETARGIQSSILPELPPQLAGVEIAHAYRPATEVGGDFYDVLALEDGRLAVAIGDVAGHGVSSGLVMSMAKSALAVQVTFNPEVEAVFKTLNRVVYQSARKRLLATLCYALLDPRRRELLYASAGHLYPYLISGEGRVHPLEFTAYPLGVRNSMEVEARLARLESGDTLFLLSDGLIEARPEGSDEMFGFERLEASLRRHRDGGVAALRDGVFEDIERFTGRAPQDDDQTVLVLRLP